MVLAHHEIVHGSLPVLSFALIFPSGLFLLFFPFFLKKKPFFFFLSRMGEDTRGRYAAVFSKNGHYTYEQMTNNNDIRVDRNTCVTVPAAVPVSLFLFFFWFSFFVLFPFLVSIGSPAPEGGLGVSSPPVPADMGTDS